MAKTAALSQQDESVSNFEVASRSSNGRKAMVVVKTKRSDGKHNSRTRHLVPNKGGKFQDKAGNIYDLD